MELLSLLSLNLMLAVGSYWLSALGGMSGRGMAEQLVEGQPGIASPSRADRWLAWGVFAGILPQMVLIGLGAGLKTLAPGVLVTAMAAIAVGAGWLARRVANWETSEISEISITRLLVDARQVWNLVASSPATALLAAILLGTYSIVVLLGLLLPPFAHDSLMYHLLMSGTWLQQGHLGFFPAPGLIQLWTYYPGGGELLFLWNLLPIRSDLLVDLSQLPFAWMGGLAAYGLARKLGAAPREALWAGAAYLMTPIVIIQSRTSYVDVIFASFGLAALNFIALYARTLNLWHLAVAGLAAGGMIGAKGSGLLYLGFFLIPVLIVILRISFRSQMPEGLRFLRILGTTMMTFLGAAGAVGGFWYIRNFLATGNPTFPFAFKIPGLISFPGPLNPSDFFWAGATKFFDSPWQWIWAPIRDLTRWVPTFTYENGFGPHLAALGLPAYFLVLAGLIRGKDWAVASLWVQGLLIIAALFLLQPFKEPRYLLIPVGLAGVAAALVLARFPGVRGWLEALLITSFVFSAATSIPAVVPTHNQQALRSFKDEREKLHPNQVYAEQRGRLGRAYGLVELLGKPGDVVVWDSLDLQYPFFGRNLRFRLVHVPFGEAGDKWLQNLTSSGAVWLVTKAGATPAAMAARNLTEIFVPVSADPEDNVFFVNLPGNRGRWEEIGQRIEEIRSRGTPVFSPFRAPSWLSVSAVLWPPALALFTGLSLGQSLTRIGLPRLRRGRNPATGELAFLLFAGIATAYYLSFHQDQIENTRLWWSGVLR